MRNISNLLISRSKKNKSILNVRIKKTKDSQNGVDRAVVKISKQTHRWPRNTELLPKTGNSSSSRFGSANRSILDQISMKITKLNFVGESYPATVSTRWTIVASRENESSEPWDLEASKRNDGATRVRRLCEGNWAIFPRTSSIIATSGRNIPGCRGRGNRGVCTAKPHRI